MGVRPREPRTKVLVPCRVKSAGGWSDACIHNISSHGLLVGLDDAPATGTYIDIRRGTLVIVGRVVWSKLGFIGVRTQDVVSVTAVVSEPRRGRPEIPDTKMPAADRRTHARLAAQGRIGREVERSRQRAMAFQFAALSIGGAGVAIFAAMEVRQALASPMAMVGAALNGAQ